MVSGYMWIVDAMRFQKISGWSKTPYIGDVTDVGRATREVRATQLFVCETLSLAILTYIYAVAFQSLLCV